MVTTFSCCSWQQAWDLFPWLWFTLVVPSNKQSSHIHSFSHWVTVCFLSYRLYSFIHPFACIWDRSVVPLSVCLFAFRSIYIYIASQMVTMDNSTSCLWWALRGFSVKFNISAILDLVVAPSNKEFHSLFALGAFSEISYFNYFSCCP